MRLHVGAEAPRIARGQQQLVEVEGAGASEIELAVLVQPRQRVVERQRRAPGGQSEDELGIGPRRGRDQERGRARDLALGCERQDAHASPKRAKRRPSSAASDRAAG